MIALPMHPAATEIDTSQPCKPSLRLSGLHLERRGITLLRDLDLELRPGEILVVTGASGTGKTTLLKAIAGIAPVSAGKIDHDPRIGYVFQEPRLLPWYTAHRNVALMAADEVTGWFDADEWLDRVGLADAKNLYPAQLSGGMRQRVSMARAMVTHPRLLLVDEPFASLDRALADELRTHLLALVHAGSIATVWVTHDSRDAAIGDHCLHLLGHDGAWTLG